MTNISLFISSKTAVRLTILSRVADVILICCGRASVRPSVRQPVTIRQCTNERTNEVYLPMNRVNSDRLPVHRTPRFLFSMQLLWGYDKEKR